MATRFPQDATTTENLWAFLLKGRNAYTPFPKDRINADGHYHPDPEHGGTFAVKGGHFLVEDPAYFDALFFSTTKSEVLAMDPQQRVLLESVYHALENAGIPMNKANGSNTSVFVSGFNHDHLAMLNTDPETTMKYKPTGTTNSLLSNRVSWFFDFKAPSLTIDTACSSSMVAMHLACQSLRSGESSMAVVSGVTMISFPTDITSMGHHGFLSQEGRCFSFDHRANGYGRGEGVGSVIVKRLSDALRDGDTIRAVIRGIGVNQDGRTAGISLPSSQAQESLMRSVYANAGLDLTDTHMVEAHGTGTAAGDPLEASAIARTFASRSKDIPLYVGAIKSCIGHLEGGAGIAGIIKGTLILENGIIPPNSNFEKANPKIPIDKWNIRFPLQNVPWPTQGLRRISINSFGVGGTNAHTILDDAHTYLTSRGLQAPHNTVVTTPTAEDIRQIEDRLKQSESAQDNGCVENGTTERTNESVPHEKQSNGNGFQNGCTATAAPCVPLLFPITSFDDGGVKRSASTLGAYLKSTPKPEGSLESQYLQDLAYTLSNKRSMFPWRSYTLAKSFAELIQNLTNDHGVPTAIRVKTAPKIGFVFTGQGAQWYAMGRELMVYPIFRRSIEAAAAYMKTLGAEWDLCEELLKTKESTRVNQPFLAHPSCVALQVALVELLASWGITPERVTGHSSGEIAAAYAASKLSRAAAWKAGYFRGYVSAKDIGKKGAMVAVGLSATDIESYMKSINDEIPGEMIIACFNSPKNNTISGDENKICALKKLLEKDNVFARKLNVPNAYHSAHMKEVADEYFERMGDLSFGETLESRAEMFSSVTGKRVTEDHLGATYWVRNMVQPVRFTDALTEMCFARLTKGQASLKINANAANVFADTIIEIGPHVALQSAIKEILITKISANLFNYLAVLNRTTPGIETILNTVGFLASRGTSVDIQSVNESSKVPSKVSHSPRLLVELPPYSFNHSERIWYESRLSRNYRLRKHPRHDLFGAPVSDWNAETPRWRHILRISEQPWLRDHVVTDAIVYPGVGYLIAVIEASKQIADPKQKLVGFRLRDIALKRALIIPDTKEGIEISLSLTRFDESSIQPSALWKKFVISSYNPDGDDWIEHCTGYIAVDCETAPGPIDAGLEAREEVGVWQRALVAAKERCTVPMDTQGLYDNLVTAGLTFGPLFRNLSDVYGTVDRAGEVFGTVTVPDVAKEMPKNYTHSHLIHPSTFDSCLHFFLVSVMDSAGKTSLDRAMVPTFIKDVWVSADINSDPGHTFQGHGKSTFLAYDKYQSDVMVWDDATGAPRISIKGVRATPLESLNSSAQIIRKLCHNIEWNADLELLTSKAFTHVKLTSNEENTEYRHWINKFQLATLLKVTDALDELKDFDVSTLEGHLAKYYNWMKQLRVWLENDQVSGMKLSEWQDYSRNPKSKAELFKQVDAHNADGTLAIRMGSNIAKVLRKEVDPLHLMFGQDDLLDHVYAQVVKLGDLPAYQKGYLEIIRHNSTNLKILEVGAGTGSSTAAMLEGLAPLNGAQEGDAELCVAKYTFTDISASFFEKAKEKFKDYRSIMEFKIFNAEKDAAAQGFDLASYDFVVAGNVVHATADLRRTLGTIQKLLKPGGKLILHEGIRQDFLWSGLSFGQLPGWWMGVEPIRQWSPWIDAPQWDEVLKDAGFTGIDLNLADRADPFLHTQSLLVATAVDSAAAKKSFSQKTFIVSMAPTAEGPNELVKGLKSHLEQIFRVPDVSVINLMDLAAIDLSQAICVSVMELERSVLENLSEKEFENVRQLIATCGGMIWITGDTLKHPEFGIITGLARTVRWERDIDEVNLVTLSISEPRPQTADLIQSIAKLYQQQFVDPLPLEKINGEYMLKDGFFHSARLIDAPAANGYLASKFSRPKPVMAPLGTAGRPVKLATASPGLLNMLEFVTDEIYDQPLAATQVEIDIKAVGLNFRDLMIAMGEHMAYSLGNEAAGLITRVGSAVTKFKPGDRVVYLCGLESTGCFHTFGRVDQNVVVHIPESISYEIAAGLPCVYATVIYGLVDAGRLLKGEKILIHAAAGGVGQAAINYSKYVGAEIFCTVSTPEKRKLLMDEYDIPEDHIFSSRDLSFVKGIMRMTNNKGVDVVLNSLAGEALRRSWDLLAPFGRFVEIGKKDAQLNGKVELHPFLRNVTMTSVELPTMMRHRPELIARLTQDTVRLYAEGHIKEAKPTTVMNFSQIEEGLRILQSGKGVGKMIFVPSPEDVVPLVQQQLLEYRLKPDATYIIAGGLGGIGRSLGSGMVGKGARNLVFLSRSGKITDAVQEMVTRLESEGCNVCIFTCDVSDKARVAEVLEECKAKLPPIKGCIQGAMTLRDGMFENMSYEAFQTAVKPKVQGSWNLHELLPHNMDFYVLLSSATGVLGNRSQSNYAAGNTYQDALARHRHTLGLPAATIDLGTVLSVGYVAENREKTHMAKHLGTVLEVLREDEIHTLIEYLMDPRSGLDGTTCQLVSGLTDATTYRQRGIPAPTYLGYPLFTHLRTAVAGSRSGTLESDPAFAVQVLLQTVTSMEQAAGIVSDGVRAKLSSLLAMPIENIDPGKSVSSNGVDSLVAMEFRAFLAKDLGADIPLLDIMGTASISILSQKIAGASKLVQIESGKGVETVNN
ncbi:iterative type I polyketide synthase [Leptodontidium sp. MPI-SDFR-AT-0119]|nr:iterative type I polyketide synthase [Leptodontidium sp. MPI-SDFR-AT-0119]